jgi:thioesterase domain-containing protein
MTPGELQRILKKQIPLSQAMGIRVLSCSAKSGVSFQLPLKPNRNHKSTAFGGTLVAAQALACWSWMMAFLAENKINAEVVLQRQQAEFLKPVHFDFKVKTAPVLKAEQKKFVKTITRHAKARLTVRAEVIIQGRLAGTYSGEYVAIII